MRLTGDEVESIMDTDLQIDKPKWTPLMSQKAVNHFLLSDRLTQHSESLARKKAGIVLGTPR